MLETLKNDFIHLYQTLLLSPIFATISLFVDRVKGMLDEESKFYSLIIISITIDLAIGIGRYIKEHKFAFDAMLSGLVVKVMVAFGAMLLFSAFASLEDGWASEWMMLVGKYAVLLYPAGSTFKNMYVLTDGRFPPVKWMKFMKAFEDMIPKVAEEVNADKPKK